MNNELLVTAKKIYDNLKDMISNPHLQIGIMRSMPEFTLDLDKVLFMDSLRFMLYVAESDGEITMRESNVINYITGEYFPVQALREIVAEERDFYIYSMPTLPMSVKIFCEVENIMYRNDSEGLENSLMNAIITYFEVIGLLISQADAEVSYKEKERVVGMISTIKKYAEENTLSPFFSVD